jgi:hypothetical protein
MHTLRSSVWALPFTFSEHNFVCILCLPCALHVPSMAAFLIRLSKHYFVTTTNYEARRYAIVFCPLPLVPLTLCSERCSLRHSHSLVAWDVTNCRFPHLFPRSGDRLCIFCHLSARYGTICIFLPATVGGYYLLIECIRLIVAITEEKMLFQRRRNDLAECP